VETLSNTYLVGLPSKRAIVIDPATFDGEMLDLIEHHGFSVTCVLLTHADEKHMNGLRTIMRVYSNVRICSARARVLDHASTPVQAGEKFKVCNSDVQAIGLPGHGRDHLAYLLGGFLFTGPALSAGELGQVSNPYAKALLQRNVVDSIFSLPDHTLIFPFYGPPSTVAIEKQILPMDDPLEPEELA
jgi:glyoxylase-like metal-dependent hydrolase (beta-lactamase superfamily II)